MSERHLERVRFAGPAGRLEGLLHRPAGGARFAAVASHPHPLHGGTMDNKVIYRVARGLEDAGGLVLRFNFRGAGRSEGRHDDGVGEQDDLRAAVRFLREVGGDALPLLLAGFSFGSVMSARVACSDGGVAGLLLVGAPLRLYSLAALATCGVPVAFIHGDRDEHGPLPKLRDFFDGLRGARQLEVIEGAGHFFDEQQDELRETVAAIVGDGVLARAVAGTPPASDP